MTPYFFLSSPKDHLFSLFSLSPKDPYFGGLVRTSPSLPYVMPPRRGQPPFRFVQFLKTRPYITEIWNWSHGGGGGGGEVGLQQKCIPKPYHENGERFGSKASGRVKIVTRVHFLQNTPNIVVRSWSPGDSSALLAAHEIEYPSRVSLLKWQWSFPFQVWRRKYISPLRLSFAFTNWGFIKNE